MKRVLPVSRCFLPVAMAIFAATAFAAPKHESATIPSEGWAQLGSSHVDGSSDHDKIDVGASKGDIRALRFTVQGAPVRFRRLQVHFVGGEAKDLSAGFVVADHAASRELGLPRKSPGVESVELWYERTAAGSRPQVTLLGRAAHPTVIKASVTPGIGNKDALCPVKQFCLLYRELLAQASPARLAEMALVLNALFHSLLEAGIGPGLAYRELLLLLSQLADQALRHARANPSPAQPSGAETPGAKQSASAAKPARVLFHLALQHGANLVTINVYLESPLAGLGPLLDFVHNAEAGK